MRLSSILVAAFLALPSLALAQTERIKVRPRIWQAEFKGSVRGSPPGGAGTELALDSDMGIDEEDANWVELMLSQGGGRTWISMWKVSPDGTAVLGTPEHLGGTDFLATETVTGEIDIDYKRLTHERFLLGQEMLGMAVIISFLSGLEDVSVDFDLNEPTPKSGSDGVSFIRPFIGFRAEAWVKQWLTLELHIVGFAKMEYDDIRARTLEWQFTASFKIDRFSIEVGYRFSDIFIEEDKGAGEKVEIEMDVEGLFFGIGVAF